MSYIEEEAIHMRKIVGIIQKEFCGKLMESNSENQSVHVHLAEHKAEEEPIDVQLTANGSDVRQIFMPEDVFEEKKTPVS